MKSIFKLKDAYIDAIIGVIIGWGGFSTLFPDLLETIGSLADLGNFFALKIFSIIFFLSIIILIGLFWWLLGMKNYLNRILPYQSTTIKYKTTIGILFLLFKILPIALFIGKTNFEFSNNNWLIWYYLFIAISQILVVYSLTTIRDLNLLKVNSLVFSLDIALGISLIAFIEPWIIYKTSFFITSVVAGSIYIIFISVLFLKDYNKKFFLHFAYLAIITSSLFAFVPAVNYSVFIGIIPVTLITILIITVYKIKNDLNNINHIIKITTLSISSILIILFFSVFLESININYFKNRLKASKDISSIKILPFAIMYDNDINNNYTCLNTDTIAIAKHIADNNYVWSYRNKTKSVNWIDTINNKGTEVAIINWKGLSKEKNIRKKYYAKYWNIKENSLQYNNIIKNQDNLNSFYNMVYHYIEDSIAKKYFEKFNKSNDEKLVFLKDYLHPINYYSKTLETYKAQENICKKLAEYNNNIITYTKLYNTDTQQVYLSSIDTLIEKINKKNTKVSELFNVIFFTGKDSFKTNNRKIVFVKQKSSEYKTFFKHLILLKTKQYNKRFKKAQNIFHVYLRDAQRIGIFILLYSILIFILLIVLTKNDTSYIKNKSTDRMNSFINITLLILIIILMHSARTIKPENINPKEPRWMMNIKNWHQPTILDNLIDDENNDKQTPYYCNINSDNNNKKKINTDDLTEAINNINTTLINMRNNNDSMYKLIDSTNNKSVNELESINKKLN